MAKMKKRRKPLIILQCMPILIFLEQLKSLKIETLLSRVYTRTNRTICYILSCRQLNIWVSLKLSTWSLINIKEKKTCFSILEYSRVATLQLTVQPSGTSNTPRKFRYQPGPEVVECLTALFFIRVLKYTFSLIRPRSRTQP